MSLQRFMRITAVINLPILGYFFYTQNYSNVYEDLDPIKDIKPTSKFEIDHLQQSENSAAPLNYKVFKKESTPGSHALQKYLLFHRIPYESVEIHPVYYMEGKWIRRFLPQQVSGISSNKQLIEATPFLLVYSGQQDEKSEPKDDESLQSKAGVGYRKSLEILEAIQGGSQSAVTNNKAGDKTSATTKGATSTATAPTDTTSLVDNANQQRILDWLDGEFLEVLREATFNDVWSCTAFANQAMIDERVCEFMHPLLARFMKFCFVCEIIIQSKLQRIITLRKSRLTVEQTADIWVGHLQEMMSSSSSEMTAAAAQPEKPLKSNKNAASNSATTTDLKSPKPAEIVMFAYLSCFKKSDAFIRFLKHDAKIEQWFNAMERKYEECRTAYKITEFAARIK